MTDDELFREALAAHADAPVVPAGFADRVVAEVGARRGRGRVAAAVGLAVACAAGVLAWRGRPREGTVSVAATAGAPVQAALGERARVVLEPGTTLRYRVGGFGPWGGDVVELAAGSAFFRVDRGGVFAVRAPHGTVQVTGTCFRVSAAADEGERAMTMSRAARARWFGAGAATAALAVMVYEGGVTLASTTPGRATRLGPGESATVHRDGSLTRGDGAASPAGAWVGALQAASAGAASRPGADDAGLAREVERLRAILAAHRISPEGGALADEAPRRRGIDDNGETDLTPEEWRVLAQRGELRYAIPGSGSRDPDGRVAHHAQLLGLREHEVAGVREVFHREHERLLGEARAAYRAAAGADPGALSLDALQSEVRDMTPGDAAALVDWQLAQERGGLAERPGPRPDAIPYERMMRALVGFEGRLDESLTALVGATAAHDLLHGPNAIGGHSYGRTAHLGDAGAR